MARSQAQSDFSIRPDARGAEGAAGPGDAQGEAAPRSRADVYLLRATWLLLLALLALVAIGLHIPAGE